MIVVPVSRPFNIESLTLAIVNSLDDSTLQQHRVRISTADLSGVQPDQLPYAKSLSMHSQVSGNSGGSTMESAHSLKVGDLILVERPTTSQQDYIIKGHAGTLAGAGGQGPIGAAASGYNNSPDQFVYNAIQTQNTKTAKPKVMQTQYADDGGPTWNNPGNPVQVTLSSANTVRYHYKMMATNYSQSPALFQPKVWDGGGQNITNNPAVGSIITQVIQESDKGLLREAQQNGNVLEMLHRLRLSLNDPSFQNFLPNANNGTVMTSQSLLSGGGLGGIGGILSNLMGIFSAMGQATQSKGEALNNAVANNQPLTASGVPIKPSLTNATNPNPSGPSVFPDIVSTVLGPEANTNIAIAQSNGAIV